VGANPVGGARSKSSVAVKQQQGTAARKQFDVHGR
jgi:hypothetical protein